MTIYDYLKNAFLILIFLQLAPVLLSGIFKQYSKFLEPHTQVGLLKISGVIDDSAYHIKNLHTFFKDKDIKAILIKMDCRGSTSGTAYSIYNEMKILKAAHPKPIIVLVENVCASGGYWISCAADHIIASSTSLIGSIGVTLPYLFGLRQFIEQYNITYTQVQAGKYKGVGNPFIDITADDKIMLQSVLDDEYNQFTQVVSKNRNIPLTTKDEWANGRIFTGEQAKGIGLIDEIGSLSNAIKVIKDKTLIEGEIEWVKPSAKRKSILQYLIGEPDNDSSLVSNVVDQVCTRLENRYGAKVQ